MIHNKLTPEQSRAACDRMLALLTDPPRLARVASAMLARPYFADMIKPELQALALHSGAGMAHAMCYHIAKHYCLGHNKTSQYAFKRLANKQKKAANKALDLVIRRKLGAWQQERAATT